MSFKKIYYDHMNNRITLWEDDEDGRTSKISVKPDIEYYIPDNTGQSGKRDIWGNSVKLQTSKSRKDMKSFIETSNIPTCESTLAEDMKYLQKRYGGKKMKAEIDNFQIATIDIELESGTEFPDNIAEIPLYPINLISVHYSKTDEIFTFGNRPYTGNDPSVKNYHYCADEKTLLERFISHFRKRKVDIITGWNVKLFDMTYFINRCDQLGVELSLSPLNKYQAVTVIDDFQNKKPAYKIAGISILDGMELFKNFTYVKQVSYSLNYIGLEVCKEGKLDLDGQVNHIYKTDWNKFVEYNVQDVVLTRKIELKKKFIELVIELCYQALVPFESVFSSIALITGYMVNYLHQKNIVFPDSKRDNEKETYPGAWVMANPGVYEHVLSFDVESMYPHMIMMYNISPETLRMHPEEPLGLYRTPGSDRYECETPSRPFSVDGIYYSKDKGVLPEIVENIFNSRKYFKSKMKVAKGIAEDLSPEVIAKNTYMDLDFVQKLYNEVKTEGYPVSYYYDQQQIRKILINSMYGVLGNRHFPFYNIKNATAITIGGRDLIQFLSDKLNEYMKGYWHKVAHQYFDEAKGKQVPQIINDVVVLIDTDSNYVCIDEIIKGLGVTFENDEDYRVWANEFDKKFFTPFWSKILDKYVDRYGVPQMINFKREKIITKMVVLKKKKYATFTIDKEGEVYDVPKLDITGIEIVKTSTPQYCRTNLDETLRFMMTYKDKDKTIDKLREIYDKFRECKVDAISYPRSINNYTKYADPIVTYLRNDAVKYKPSTPQHVKAGINYNFIINKYNLNLQPIGNGTKIKFVKVDPKNELGTDVIAYIHTYPKEFHDIFNIDYEEQWKKSFEDVIQRFFTVFDWGKVVLDRTALEDFIEF